MILFTYSACEECFYKQNIFLNTRDRFDDSASLSESRVNVQQVITRRPMRVELHHCMAECPGGTRSGGAFPTVRTYWAQAKHAGRCEETRLLPEASAAACFCLSLLVVSKASNHSHLQIAAASLCRPHPASPRLSPVSLSDSSDLHPSRNLGRALGMFFRVLRI